jgi:uncharacterized protein YbjT (DUF2867 family)
MRIAITGGTGFVGRHLARDLVARGHQVVLVARGADRRDPTIYDLLGSQFVNADLSDPAVLTRAFTGCAAVAHCAGINREVGSQTYQRVHVAATQNVVSAAEQAGVKRIAMLSFLRARPNCGSAYHESKWEAEEIVRRSNLDCTIVKAGVIYGRGDHMLDHLSHAVHTFPVFGLVGFKEKPIRPLAVDDLVTILRAALIDGRLTRQTVAATGPEELLLGEAVRRVAAVVGKNPVFVPLPLAMHWLIAIAAERAMKVPMISLAQLRILSEGIVDPLPTADTLPADLAPQIAFTNDQIRKGLPPPGAFGWKDLRCSA